jgi:aldehyde:ferredoxin oxidoreductase
MTSEERAFDRGGLGVVLGSKNIKALTFGGGSAPEIELSATQQEIHREAATEDHIMKHQGTVSVMDLANEVEGLPSYYFSERQFEGVEGINGDAVEEKKFKKGPAQLVPLRVSCPRKTKKPASKSRGQSSRSRWPSGRTQESTILWK